MKKLLTMMLVALSSTLIYGAPLNLKKGVAIKGYDPVAYFNASKPTKGSSEFVAEHKGATYHFSNITNRDLFIKSPTKYTPQYGGYCAYGVGLGKLVKIDPKVYVIHEGKLYLNYSKSIAKKYEADLATSILTSDKEWTKFPK